MEIRGLTIDIAREGAQRKFSAFLTALPGYGGAAFLSTPEELEQIGGYCMREAAALRAEQAAK